jgi:hypothetical protein
LSEPTSSCAAVVADTIVRTVELGVTITDAAVDGDVTVVFCDLLTDGVGVCPRVCPARGLPRYGGALCERRARGWASAAPAGAGTPLPLHDERL